MGGFLRFLRSPGGRVAAVAVVLAAITVLAAFYGRNPPAIWVVNGFDQPLTVRVNEQAIDVPPHGQALVKLLARHATLEITGADGARVDSMTDSFGDTDILNPLGAAPLRKESWYWTPDGTRAVGSITETPVDLCGERRVSASDVDDVLRTPGLVSFARGEKGQRRIVIDFERDAPATACVAALRQKQRAADAEAIERFAH